MTTDGITSRQSFQEFIKSVFSQHQSVSTLSNFHLVFPGTFYHTLQFLEVIILETFPGFLFVLKMARYKLSSACSRRLHHFSNLFPCTTLVYVTTTTECMNHTRKILTNSLRQCGDFLLVIDFLDKFSMDIKETIANE